MDRARSNHSHRFRNGLVYLGHWGDFQIDNGRELYVPVSILHGKLLYRDIWYMYGPLAPYQPSLHGNDL